MAESFNLFDRELILEDNFIADVVLHSETIKLAEKASEMFDKYYHSELHSLEDIINKSPDAATFILNKCAEAYVDMLNSEEVYFVSVPEILIRMDGSYFEETMKDLRLWAISNKLNEKIKDVERKERRKNRSKVVIRGRTLAGAIAGATTAGALNLASGAIHGTANVLGKSFSSMGSSITKAGVFNDPNTCIQFCNAMYMDVFDWVYIVEDILIENGIPLKRISIADEEKCEKLLKNLHNENLNQSQAYDIAFLLFKLNPSEFNYYDFCMKRFPEQQVNLLRLAECCEVDLTTSIDNIFQTIFNASKHRTEEEVKLIREKMQAKQEELGVSSSTAIEKVDAMLQDFDVKARTFRDITYETREQRQKAEADFNDLTTLCNKIEKLDSESCIHLKEEISEKEYTPNISKMFLLRIERRKREIDRNEAENFYKELFKKYEAENPDLKKYKVLEKLINAIHILGGLIFIGCLLLAGEACSEGSIIGTIVLLIVSCLLPFIFFYFIDEPLEKRKTKTENMMSQDLLEAKERKEATQKAYDEIAEEIKQQLKQ